ncbi:MAG TPA: aspartate--ammonia ligase [Candidatus Avirikenella pullistercoris]|nr:aspartate--ammonia ligase [Candidatus Avirikenella pullistercoris]
MPLYLPKTYRAKLGPETTEQAIKMLKDTFQTLLSEELCLRRVTAPLFVLSGTGINDDLNGSERAVTFPIKDLDNRKAEVVHSLAKWKRMKLGEYDIAPGYGLYTDMNAIRADEELDNIHSIYVDQWDWERTIREEDRNLKFLKSIVKKIYHIIREVEQKTYRTFSHITPILPEEITFIHSEALLQAYPHLSPKERENEAAKKYGAIFIIGIGSTLSNGEKHDGRAPDYDDWSSETENGYKGLNGDIIFWNPILESAYEISSMGIRVNKIALKRQLEITGSENREKLLFHQALLNDKIPLSIGGGIGQSRLCMFFLRCAHIGEVQSSIWPETMIEECRKNGIFLK